MASPPRRQHPASDDAPARLAHGVTPFDGADADVDVLVVGAGGAGLVCAIAAHDAGAQVAVVEKLPALLGNTMLSSGSIPGAGTRWQRAAGIADDPSVFEADLRRQSGAHDSDALVGVLARVSAPLVEWLADAAGIELSLITLYRHVGHSVPRLHAPPSRRGADLMAGLLRAVEKRGIPVAFGNRAAALLWDGQRVRGALVRSGAESTAIGAQAVVLATNGFGANAALRGEYCAATAGYEYAGAPGSEGEAIEWGRALGARLANMGAYQGHASYAVPHGLLATWTLMELGGVIVDRHGRRVGNESLGYSAFSEISGAADAPLYAVYDTRIRDVTAIAQQEYAELAGAGGAIEAPDAAALAARLHVDAEALRATLDAAAAASRGEAEDAFGRRNWGRAPLQPPYVATRIATALLHTQGGLAVDGEARVQHGDGSVVAGLYAAGGAAAGISGRTGSRGYTSGNGLLAALGLGLIAGRSAGAAVARARGQARAMAGSTP